MPHTRARASAAEHEVRRLPVVIPDGSPEAALVSLEVLRGVLLLLPRDWLKQALLRLRSIVLELSVLVDGGSSNATSSSEPFFAPV